MILSDRDIKSYFKSGKIVIRPEPTDEQMQSAWVDLTLGSEFKTFKRIGVPMIDPKNPQDYTENVKIEHDKPFILHPGEFVLGSVNEYIELPDDLAGAVDGRSSLGRLGVLVHLTSTFVDPGFAGKLTLEITNIGTMPVALYPGMRVCKLVFFQLSSPSERPYSKRKDAKYYGQKGILQSKIEKEFE